MNRIIFILMLIISSMAAKAQNASINIDRKTVAAMEAAFDSEYAIEKAYNEQIEKILDKYGTAELATNTIFASRFLERRAMTDLGVWCSSTENYYYRRIYNLVATKMIPKIVTVAKLMMKNPENALYWGSYLLKICEETKALCLQFQTVVTNSKLGFNQINFLEMKPEVKQLFEVAHNNIVNWDNMLQVLTSAPDHFSKEKLKEDIDNLYKIGHSMAEQLAENVLDRVMAGTNFKDVMEGKIMGIYSAVISCERIYGNVNALLAGELKQIIGDTLDPSRIFNLAKLSVADWLNDYANLADGQYYTQRWYIYSKESGFMQIVNYEPPTDYESVSKGSEWYRIPTTDPNYQPTVGQLSAIMKKSETASGWSQKKVNELNAQSNGHKYEFESTMHSRQVKYGDKLVAIAYAHSIRVYEVWDRITEVEEATFDSYSMDLNTFLKKMEVRLKEWNENDKGIVYQLGCDERNYYSASSVEKLKGVDRVAISVTCHDRMSLMSGKTSYKCKQCKGHFPDHTKQCSLWTSIKEDNIDTSELDASEAECRRKISNNKSAIAELEQENSRLLKLIAGASSEDAAAYRKKIIENQDRITVLNNEIKAEEAKINDIQTARNEIALDSENQVDSHYRIPAIMNDCKTAYQLVWSGEGHWEGTSYYRKGKVQGTNTTLTFKADIKYARDAQYFIGIMIHRPIIQIEYELLAEQSSTDIVDVLTLSEEMTDAEKEKLVNDRISEIARTYPECQVETQYIMGSASPPDDTQDVSHLLWSSDRLEIARGIDMRLHKIYANLVSVEKMMNYKRSIIDVLLTLAPPIDTEQGRRQTLVQEARKRWLGNAARISHSGKYNGKYETDNNSKLK